LGKLKQKLFVKQFICQLQNSEVEDFTEMADEFYIDANIRYKVIIYGRCFLLQGKKATIFNGTRTETKAVLCGGFDDLHCLPFELQKGFQGVLLWIQRLSFAGNFSENDQLFGAFMATNTSGGNFGRFSPIWIG
jgi:hypothetical protein